MPARSRVPSDTSVSVASRNRCALVCGNHLLDARSQQSTTTTTHFIAPHPYRTSSSAKPSRHARVSLGDIDVNAALGECFGVASLLACWVATFSPVLPTMLRFSHGYRRLLCDNQPSCHNWHRKSSSFPFAPSTIFSPLAHLDSSLIRLDGQSAD
ncbi:hypothetical protein DL93DRAFT_2173420 [Clavulina sp. PMI_390]|nr:hypothetical protein DL93DRAFT_2173420 [Clavulina sp. PMI_390]